MVRADRRSAGLVLALLLAGLSGCGVAGTAPAPPAAADPTAAWLARGAELYARDCASCHGAKGEGQANWALPLADGSLPAPPHDATGHTWHHADEDLLAIIAEGGTIYSPNSKMPGFRDKLSPEEQRAVLDHIKTMWGRRELDYQAEVSAQRLLERAAAATSAAPEPSAAP